MSQSEDNFIGRWSRRKKEASSPALVADDESVSSSSAESDAVEQLPSDDAGEENRIDTTVVPEAATGQTVAVPTDADMVALDTLNADSDYAPFMSEGVSSELRKAALKKLFFSGKFAARDGLDDYDDDFTYFEPLGDTVTSDMKYHARRKEKERLAKLEEERLALEQQSDANSTDTEKVEAESADDSSVSDADPQQKPEEVDNSDVPIDGDAPVDVELPVDGEKSGIHVSTVADDDQPLKHNPETPGSNTTGSESGNNA